MLPVIIEPLPLPDFSRGVRMPSLPGWVASRLALIRDEQQPHPETGRYRTVPTLPQNLVLRPDQRDLIERHIAELERLCEQSPLSDPDQERATLVVIGRIMLVYPSATPNEASSAARAETFMMVLDDLPTWAVVAAERRWARGEIDKDSDPHWCPAPAELRKLAMSEVQRVRARVAELRKLLRTEGLIEYSDEHCAMMRARLDAIIPFRRTVNGSGGTVGRS